MEKLNLHTYVDEEAQAIIDDLFAHYEAEPNTLKKMLAHRHFHILC